MASKNTFLVLVAVAAMGYYAYAHLVPHGGGAGGAPGGASPVSMAEVTVRKVQLWNEFSGRLTAVDQADIRPQVSGVIESVHFEDGAKVNKGDLLFIIDPRPYEAALQAANARAVLADSELQRAVTLLKEKAIPQRDYDQRKNDAAVARADLARARLDLDYTHIKSPMTGRAGRAEITEGNLVESGSGAPVLTTVVSDDPIYADFEIDEDTYMGYIHDHAVGTQSRNIPVRMELGAAPSAPREGHVESFDNRLNPASGTLRVRAVFDNGDGALVPGLFVRIRLGGLEEKETVLITDRAVGTDQSKKFVYVVGENNQAVYREIKLGPVADGLRVVKDGLKPGEKIVVSGLQRVRPGQPVTPEIVPMEGQMSDDRRQMTEEEKKQNAPKE